MESKALIQEKLRLLNIPPDPLGKNVKSLIDEIEKSEEGGVLPQTKPVLVAVRTEEYCEINGCFINVKEKVKRDGGAYILGWALRDEFLFMVAEFHAVWESPSKDLLDITPKGMDPNNSGEYIVAPAENILFVPAPKATYEGKQRPYIFSNVSGNPLIDDLIDCELGIFYLMNKGDRANQYGYITLSEEDSKQRFNIQGISKVLLNMVHAGMASYNGACGCQSGEKYKHCHRKILRRMVKKN